MSKSANSWISASLFTHFTLSDFHYHKNQTLGPTISKTFWILEFKSALGLKATLFAVPIKHDLKGIEAVQQQL